ARFRSGDRVPHLPNLPARPREGAAAPAGAGRRDLRARIDRIEADGVCDDAQAFSRGARPGRAPVSLRAAPGRGAGDPRNGGGIAAIADEPTIIPLVERSKEGPMRKLLISVFALLAGLAPLATLHAAGTDSGPAPNARPVDPDYESGKKAVEAGNWKAALDSFERVASRDPGNADAQNYLGYAWRKSGNLDLAFKHYNEALRLNPRHKGAHEYIG